MFVKNTYDLEFLNLDFLDAKETIDKGNFEIEMLCRECQITCSYLREVNLYTIDNL